jgi:hypothetical protein
MDKGRPEPSSASVSGLDGPSVRTVDYTQARCVQITGPCPVRQQVLQSTFQQVLPAAEAGGAETSAANPVQITAANTTTAAHLTFFFISSPPGRGT